MCIHIYIYIYIHTPPLKPAHLPHAFVMVLASVGFLFARHSHNRNHRRNKPKSTHNPAQRKIMLAVLLHLTKLTRMRKLRFRVFRFRAERAGFLSEFLNFVSPFLIWRGCDFNLPRQILICVYYRTHNMYIYIYVYIYIHLYIYVYIYI